MNRLWKSGIIVASVMAFWVIHPWLAIADGAENGDKMVSHYEEKKQGMVNEIIEGLGLTDEQKQQIQAHHETMRTERERFLKAGKEQREALKQELEKPEIDRAKIDQLVAQIAALQTERLKSRVEGVLAVRSILTPAQFAEMNKKLESKYETFKKMKKDPMKEKSEGEMRMPSPEVHDEV